MRVAARCGAAFLLAALLPEAPVGELTAADAHVLDVGAVAGRGHGQRVGAGLQVLEFQAAGTVGDVPVEVAVQVDLGAADVALQVQPARAGAQVGPDRLRAAAGNPEADEAVLVAAQFEARLVAALLQFDVAGGGRSGVTAVHVDAGAGGLAGELNLSRAPPLAKARIDGDGAAGANVDALREGLVAGALDAD